MQKTYLKKPSKIKSKIDGCFLINLNKNIDHRGYFFNIFDGTYYFQNFHKKSIKQINISENKERGTIRGLHYQSEPFSDNKIVTCIKGKIYDVVLDLRVKSKTFGMCEKFELSEKNNLILHIPKNCAHGYQTLQKDTIILYLHSQIYKKKHDKGYYALDKNLNINWPIKKKIMSDKDKNLKNFSI